MIWIKFSLAFNSRIVVPLGMFDKHIRTTQTHYETQRDNVVTLKRQLLDTVQFITEPKMAYSDAYLGLNAIESHYDAKIEAIIDGEWISEGNW